MRIIEFENEDEWIDAAVREFEDLLAEVQTEWRLGLRLGRSRLRLCLAGGGTPEPVYRALAGHPVSGLDLELWPGDERLVPEGHEARNGAMIARAFAASAWKPAPRLVLWPVPPADLESLGAEARLAAAERLCAQHEERLRFEMGEEPSFDLAFLGLGADGHTMSLFPGQAILAESSRFCAASLAPDEPRTRLSFTYPVLSRVRRIRFLVRGGGKAEILRRLAAGDQSLPAARIGVEDQAVFYCRN